MAEVPVVVVLVEDPGAVVDVVASGVVVVDDPFGLDVVDVAGSVVDVSEPGVVSSDGSPVLVWVDASGAVSAINGVVGESET
ncbi:MAG: hypothetical protein ACLGHX_13260 [Acidimicrobiia bacterium]